MHEQMTKAKLVAKLLVKRAEWDRALAKVPPELMTEAGVAGDWSVKDIIAHLTYYERWISDRFQEQLQGRIYLPTDMDFMGEARNVLIYQQNRGRSLEDVVAESRQIFQTLLEGMNALPEKFLIEPQQVEGAPQPVIVWKLLRSEVYEHYGEHVKTIEAWLVARKSSNFRN